jgi:hypothetical protein
MTVRDVKSLGHGNNPLGHAMAGTDDQIMVPEIKLLNGRGKEGEIVAIMLHDPGESLKEGCPDPHPLDDARETIPPMDQRIEICLGIELAQSLKNPLPSSHSCEPIMNDGDLQAAPPIDATAQQASSISKT